MAPHPPRAKGLVSLFFSSPAIIPWIMLCRGLNARPLERAL
jgi:hypothetical protein